MDKFDNKPGTFGYKPNKLGKKKKPLKTPPKDTTEQHEVQADAAVAQINNDSSIPPTGVAAISSVKKD